MEKRYSIVFQIMHSSQTFSTTTEIYPISSANKGDSSMKMVTFEKKIQLENIKIKRDKILTLQVNIGKKCNQTCTHCHVASGPARDENMDKRTVERILALLKKDKTIQTIDITGGAPELNLHFKYFISKIREMNLHVMHRCNLTALLEKGQEETAQFLADNSVEIVASLPCYTEQNVDSQRGKGTFQKSIEALKLLNNLGYGKEGQDLILNLVYNPGGAFLPGQQGKLEADYKNRLNEDHGIVFNKLFTITNMPLNRFGDQLKKEDKLDEYLELLVTNFNTCAAANVMCSTMLSVGWDGTLYDCDFNQMLEKPVSSEKNTIHKIESFQEITSNIVLHDACYGCTAGSGSSCGGALA